MPAKDAGENYLPYQLKKHAVRIHPIPMVPGPIKVSAEVLASYRRRYDHAVGRSKTATYPLERLYENALDVTEKMISRK